MPLIPQQDILFFLLSAYSNNMTELLNALKKHLDTYPPVRIVSISNNNFGLTVVIETV